MRSVAVAPRLIPILSRNEIRNQTASSIYSCAFIEAVEAAVILIPRLPAVSIRRK